MRHPIRRYRTQRRVVMTDVRGHPLALLLRLADIADEGLGMRRKVPIAEVPHVERPTGVARARHNRAHNSGVAAGSPALLRPHSSPLGSRGTERRCRTFGRCR